MSDHRGDASPDDILREIPPDEAPPRGLRKRVVQHLTASGRLRPHAGDESGARPIGPGRWLLTAAALVVAFLAGRASAPVSPLVDPTRAPETTLSSADSPGAPTARWAFLLYEDGRYEPGELSMEELDSVYVEWATQGPGAGRVEAVQKFGATEYLLDEGDAEPSLVGTRPPPGALAGAYIVRAPSLDEALDLARRTPHWQMGGGVIIRFLEPL